MASLYLAESRGLRLTTFAALYGAQGVPIGLLSIAIPAWLAERGVELAAIAAYSGIVGLPWAFKLLAGPFMDEADLVQEGFIGLLRAAKRFDPDRNIRFSTYARWWVRAQMTRAIDHTGRPVRLPGCAVEQTRNLRKAIKHFDTLGMEYSVADLAEEVGIDEKRAEFLLSQGQTISLDQPMEDGDRPRPLQHFLADEETLNPDEESIHAQEIARMITALGSVLSERHRHVLIRRYGLEDNQFRTLSEVGASMSLSRERVRQIEREALTRLREHALIREKVA